jgi:phospholipid-binding lipoprotein MlaA
MSESGTRGRLVRAAVACALAGAVCACASSGGAGVSERDPDPWEKMNRGIFDFNERLDTWVLEPVGKAWAFVLPKPVRHAIQNVSENLWMPAVFGNHVVQGRPDIAIVEDLPRLIVNTTIGLGGIFDVATRLGIAENYTDFGITMGRWGVPPGPYFVIPIFGPSSVRGVVGRVADTASTPYMYFVPWYAIFAFRTVELLNIRSLYIEEIHHVKADALDYYAFMRDAWTQNRLFYVRQARGEPAVDPFDEDDLYFLDAGDSEEGQSDSADDDLNRDATTGVTE